jgi:hypothetical protein
MAVPPKALVYQSMESPGALAFIVEVCVWHIFVGLAEAEVGAAGVE